MAEEVIVFRDTALDTLAKHHYRWLTSHVDLTAFFPQKAVAVEMARGLLAVWDGLPLPTVDDAVKQQQIFGDNVDLEDLVKVVLQFATPEVLAETRFFRCPESVADLRLFVASSGNFEGEWGERLARKIKTFVLALPFHSHAAERCVNAGVPLLPKYAPHKSQAAMAGELAAILDEIRLFQRFAVAENERFEMENGATPKWSTDCRGVTRQIPPPTRNKAIFQRHANHLDGKANRITSDVEQRAKQRQRQLAAAGKSRKCLTTKHKKAKLAVGQKKEQKKKASSRTKMLTSGEVAAKAAVYNVISREKPAEVVGTIALELENRGLPVKRVKKEGATKGDVAASESKAGMLKRLIGWHDDPAQNSSGDFGKPGGDIPKTTDYDGGRKGPKWMELGSGGAGSNGGGSGDGEEGNSNNGGGGGNNEA